MDGTWPWGSEKRENRKLSGIMLLLSFAEHTKAVDQGKVLKAERGTKDRGPEGRVREGSRLEREQRPP